MHNSLMWVWKELLAPWCLSNIQWIQLFSFAFLFGVVFTVAVLARKSSQQLLRKIDCLRGKLRESQAYMEDLERQIKFYHPEDGSKCDQECNHGPNTPHA